MVFEGAREIAKDVTEAVVGEKEIGGEFGPCSGQLFGLLGGGSGPRSLERRRSRGSGAVTGGAVRVSSSSRIWGGERAVA